CRPEPVSSPDRAPRRRRRRRRSGWRYRETGRSESLSWLAWVISFESLPLGYESHFIRLRLTFPEWNLNPLLRPSTPFTLLQNPPHPVTLSLFRQPRRCPDRQRTRAIPCIPIFPICCNCLTSPNWNPISTKAKAAISLAPASSVARCSARHCARPPTAYPAAPPIPCRAIFYAPETHGIRLST